MAQRGDGSSSGGPALARAKGRSAAQVEAYEQAIRVLRDLLVARPMTVREIREALAVRRGGRVLRPAAATIYARIAVLTERGHPVRARKRRGKIAGKSGQRERVYSMVTAS